MHCFSLHMTRVAIDTSSVAHNSGFFKKPMATVNFRVSDGNSFLEILVVTVISEINGVKGHTLWCYTISQIIIIRSTLAYQMMCMNN